MLFILTKQMPGKPSILLPIFPRQLLQGRQAAEMLSTVLVERQYISRSSDNIKKQHTWVMKECSHKLYFDIGPFDYINILKAPLFKVCYYIYRKIFQDNGLFTRSLSGLHLKSRRQVSFILNAGKSSSPLQKSWCFPR